jgi:hypothetical protein
MREMIWERMLTKQHGKYRPFVQIWRERPGCFSLTEEGAFPPGESSLIARNFSRLDRAREYAEIHTANRVSAGWKIDPSQSIG